MANWSKYTITNKTNYSGYIRFNLDSEVNYSGGYRRFHIDLARTLPYTEWETGDRIDIDTDKTRRHDTGKTFDFWENVAFQRTSHLENKYNEAVREKGDTERERNEWKNKYYNNIIIRIGTMRNIRTNMMMQEGI